MNSEIIYYCGDCNQTSSQEFGQKVLRKCPTCGKRILFTGMYADDWRKLNEGDKEKNKIKWTAELNKLPTESWKTYLSWIIAIYIVVKVVEFFVPRFLVF